MHSLKLAKFAIKKGAVQKVSEMSPLISLLKKRKLRTIVEIGTAGGGTFYAWCKIAEPDATIVSIDLPGGPFGGGYSVKDIKRFRKYKRKNQRLYFFRKDSHKKSTKKELMKKIKGRKIDFLFIDGDHRYSGVKKDWNLYSPLVKRKGLIVFHDILPHPKVPLCKVDKLWNEIKDNYKQREFIDIHDDRGWGQWGGIGVIYYDTTCRDEAQRNSGQV
jgi:predicted O-methyltransferase YrrM